MMIEKSEPYVGPSYSLGHRLRRQLWNIVWLILIFPSPRPFHAWRAFILRMFGAKLGKGCHIYPKATIWAPWNLRCGDYVAVADHATLYCMDIIDIGDCVVISQGAQLCGGTHDYNSANFQLVVKPIRIGARAWVCANAFVHPGVVVPEGTVVGACSVVPKSLEKAWAVYAGNPCRWVGERKKNT